jgi:plasmid stabilization system protein ParE
MPVRLTRTAIADRIDIRAHIARESPHAASHVAVQLLAACDRLARLPRRGRPGRAAGTRELVAQYPYVIV